jgi:hypothetical protein
VGAEKAGGRGAYEVSGGGAEAEPPGDAEHEVLPEEELGLRPVAALPREGLEPGAEVVAIGVAPPPSAHLRPYCRLPAFALAGSHNMRAPAQTADKRRRGDGGLAGM